MKQHTSPLLVVVFTACILGLGMVGSVRHLAANAPAPFFLQGKSTQLADGYLENANFECKNGVYQVTDVSGQILTIPTGWSWAPISGTPKLISTRIQVTGDCNGSGFVDRLEGEDSFMIRSQDIETPPLPGKPFDVAIYQQVSVITGTAYSASGFMVSLCGGSATPTDCPAGNYIAKMVGLDPTGGTDPLADTVTWVENRQPHVAAQWVNLYATAQASSTTMTVFVRVNSPFQWHGNHAIVDLFSMVEAPTATLTSLPETVQVTGTTGIPTGTHIVQGSSQEIRWAGALSSDITALEGEAYALTYAVQFRKSSDETWTNLVDEQIGEQDAADCIRFSASELNETYLFRLSARAARPTTGGHRYLSPWSEPVAIHFLPTSGSTGTMPVGPELLYLPIIQGEFQQSCN